jgi:ATP-dependent DNA helicase RecG
MSAPEAPLPLQYVKGIGPRRAEVLAKDGIRTPQDLILWVPRTYVTRTGAVSIADLQRVMARPDLWNEPTGRAASLATEVTIIARVTEAQERTFGKGRRMLSVGISDGSGAVARLAFWNHLDYWRKMLMTGSTIVVSGIPDLDARFRQITFHHPEIERFEEEDVEEYARGVILPKYTLTQGMRGAGITMRLLRTVVQSVLEPTLQHIEDPLPPDLCTLHRLMPKRDAVRALHLPATLQQADEARRRMKYEELFFFELLLAARQRSRSAPERGLRIDTKSPLARGLVERLPYQLTGAQRRVIREITEDMASGRPMNRLLQGDVGSGKTIVALLCMLVAVDHGYQTLLMAPTEILAEQHARSIARWLEGTGVNVVELTGSQRSKARKYALQQIESGDAQIIVGTHALFEAQVQYKNLGLIVVDEQHRFGVAQRAELVKMGRSSHAAESIPHVLVMSATPIPRTLSMTLYGDLQASVIDELPPGRTPIRTSIVFESGLPKVHEFIREQVNAGRQAYIVYPLVEQSEKMQLKSAIEHHELLQQVVFPEFKLGLLHGQLAWDEKEHAMRAFLDREYQILVATTVIEVGVDVPNATVMLIENAERFGLSQLHQLRGRVGRGSDQSYCFLATKDHFRYAVGRSGAAEERAAAIVRLSTMEETTDGFKIAEVDLTLRGPGDLMGTRQSGLPDFTFADLVKDGPIIAQARTDAFALMQADPKLERAEHARTKERLIAIFEGASSYMHIA